MFQSLLLKMAMLTVTAGLVLWIGWPLPTPEQGDPVSPATGARVDLNRANSEELTRLPGIGQVLAQRIIERRQNNGLYESVEGLLEVRGIGKQRLERLRPLVLISKNPKPSKAITGKPSHSPQSDRQTS